MSDDIETTTYPMSSSAFPQPTAVIVTWSDTAE